MTAAAFALSAAALLITLAAIRLRRASRLVDDITRKYRR